MSCDYSPIPGTAGRKAAHVAWIDKNLSAFVPVRAEVAV